MATLTTTAMQLSSTHAALLCTDLLVQIKQVLRDLRSNARPLTRRRAELALDVGDHAVAPFRDRRDLRCELLALGRERRQPLLRVFPTFHDFQHGVFEVAAALLQRGDLRLQVLQLTWRADLAGVEPLLIAGGTSDNLFDVGFGFALLPGDVALFS